MRISVVTACYNSRETIRDALDSVALQRYPHKEHVIIDGASTDGTLELVRAHGSPEVLAASEPDGGIYDALNKGIRRSNGDVIGFLHADDVFADDEVLERVAQEFSDPMVDAVYGDLQYVGKDDVTRIIRHWRSAPFTRQKLSRGWMPPHPTLYVRRSIYERLGGFDTSYRIAADYDFILRLFTQPGLRAVYLPHVLVKMRLGGASNRSLANVIQKSREDLRALRRHRVGGIGALAWKNLSKLAQFVVKDA
ncbi:glycosyltransferase family 2 protein [Methylococcus sp. Mc7]|uniref:glycosyltransferase family 2 protein n=1 Tax=Methylococcus sp. Mc7 TaxID=2860258 RepID=UPI001C532AE1|nr:glycosyltransferase family 2 protein [Methylococcus sp. Mc7]QXP84013.1 glycosyltransferase [Methylococcus sp. Mc7]